MCQHRDLVVEGWVCEMVIFEPAELSIGCHHLIGEIERTKSGDSISVYSISHRMHIYIYISVQVLV